MSRPGATLTNATCANRGTKDRGLGTASTNQVLGVLGAPRPCPGAEPARLISDRGSSPAWSPDGRQIYYTAAGVLWAVDVTPGDDFQVGGTVPLIDPWTFSGTAPVRSYDVFPDGSFVGRVEDDDGRSLIERYGAAELHVILNFFELLKDRLPN